MPSGNFGNLMGGIIAREMGMKTDLFIVATNMNNEVPEFLRTGTYSPLIPSVNCISNAMNVGHPSNLARIVTLYGGSMTEDGTIKKEPDVSGMRKDMRAFSVNDEETLNTIKDFYNNYKYIIDPHGAVAWKALELYQAAIPGKADRQCTYIPVETAHPGKFSETIARAIGIEPEIPDSIKTAMGKIESYDQLDNNYGALNKYLKNN